MRKMDLIQHLHQRGLGNNISCLATINTTEMSEGYFTEKEEKKNFYHMTGEPTQQWF
jgi:hypothetical protein